MNGKGETEAILAGYVVLDPASLITGPYCATLPADLGRRLSTGASALGLEALQNDKRFSTPQKRLDHRAELKAVLIQTFKTKRTEEWLSSLEQLDVPCGPVLDYERLLANPQVMCNNLVRNLPQSRLQHVRTVGNSIRLGRTPPAERRSAPALGEDTVSVLHDLGYLEDEIEIMREENII